ncbi:hypothetical protein PLESTF_001746800 [Pleodorina starrii]|nr:hypothetical protein PLESTM_001361900 [Pleodorina starrii]GLC76181.1 hypothetical protein PLESTF_001746800 [Pleodorina starrii]
MHARMRAAAASTKGEGWGGRCGRQASTDQVHLNSQAGRTTPAIEYTSSTPDARRQVPAALATTAAAAGAGLTTTGCQAPRQPPSSSSIAGSPNTVDGQTCASPRSAFHPSFRPNDAD